MSKKCPWCNSENNHKFLELKDYFLTQEEFEILECDDCKLLFTSPCPTPDKIGDYYKSEDYLSHNEDKKGLFAKIYNKVKRINIKNKFNIAISHQPSAISHQLLAYWISAAVLVISYFMLKKKDAISQESSLAKMPER